MNINLDNIDLDTIVESAVVKTLTNSLAKNLPAVVEKMLNNSGKGYPSDSLLNRTITEAVRSVVNRCVCEHVTAKQDEIALVVKRLLEQQFDSDAIAKTITTQMSTMSIKVTPFKVASRDIEDEDEA